MSLPALRLPSTQGSNMKREGLPRKCPDLQLLAERVSSSLMAVEFR